MACTIRRIAGAQPTEDRFSAPKAHLTPGAPCHWATCPGCQPAAHAAAGRRPPPPHRLTAGSLPQQWPAGPPGSAPLGPPPAGCRLEPKLPAGWPPLPGSPGGRGGAVGVCASGSGGRPHWLGLVTTVRERKGKPIEQIRHSIAPAVRRKPGTGVTCSPPYPRTRPFRGAHHPHSAPADNATTSQDCKPRMPSPRIHSHLRMFQCRG